MCTTTTGSRRAAHALGNTVADPLRAARHECNLACKCCHCESKSIKDRYPAPAIRESPNLTGGPGSHFVLLRAKRESARFHNMSLVLGPQPRVRPVDGPFLIKALRAYVIGDKATEVGDGESPLIGSRSLSHA